MNIQNSHANSGCIKFCLITTNIFTNKQNEFWEKLKLTSRQQIFIICLTVSSLCCWLNHNQAVAAYWKVYIVWFIDCKLYFTNVSSVFVSLFGPLSNSSTGWICFFIYMKRSKRSKIRQKCIIGPIVSQMWTFRKTVIGYLLGSISIQTQLANISHSKFLTKLKHHKMRKFRMSKSWIHGK